MKWLIPWHPLQDGAREDALLIELRREVCESHPLFGVAVRPLGSRQDCDDVLFSLLDGSNRFAVVHLPFAQHPESDPTWPKTRLFDSWEQFEREVMIPDNQDF